jgi:hypothetical protein
MRKGGKPTKPTDGKRERKITVYDKRPDGMRRDPFIKPLQQPPPAPPKPKRT